MFASVSLHSSLGNPGALWGAKGGKGQPYGDNRPKNPEIVCLNCGEKGHPRRLCPHPKNPIQELLDGLHEHDHQEHEEDEQVGDDLCLLMEEGGHICELEKNEPNDGGWTVVKGKNKKGEVQDAGEEWTNIEVP